MHAGNVDAHDEFQKKGFFSQRATKNGVNVKKEMRKHVSTQVPYLQPKMQMQIHKEKWTCEHKTDTNGSHSMTKANNSRQRKKKRMKLA
jgi:hypothetical protein